MATTPVSPAIGEAVPQPRYLLLSVRAGEVFANQEKALIWLQSPNPSLNGQTPLDAASTLEGFDLAGDILTRIEHGVLG